MSKDAQHQYEAIARSVRASDSVMQGAAEHLLSVVGRMEFGDVGVNHSVRVQILREVDRIVRDVFVSRGGHLNDSLLYKVIREESERIFLTQVKTGLDSVDGIMKNVEWWPRAKKYWQSVPMSVIEHDDLATAYRMLYGPHVDKQRLLNARLFDPQRTWVDARGYRLSDRIWRQGEAYRSHIDGVLQKGIRQGWSAEKLAGELRQYVDPANAPLKYTKAGRVYRTKSGPYRPNAASSARRLARTEITRVSGEGAKERARATPGVVGLRLRLSVQHPKFDVCDDYASADNYGLGAGVYPVDAVTWYPLHPHEMCTLVPVHEPRDVTRQKIVNKYRAEAFAEAGFDPERGYLW